MSSICNILINYMINKNIIDENKKEIYSYGMKMVIYKIGYALIILSICLILKRSFFNLILFYFSYMSIRKYSGGYHAPNIQICMLIFAITYYLLDWFILLFLNVNVIIIFIFSVLLLFLIYQKSPCDCENKRLNEKEKIEYKKYTMYLLLFWLIVSIIFVVTKSPCYLTILYTYLSIYIFLLI